MTKEIIISWLCILILASLISVGEVGAIQVLPDTSSFNPDPVLDPKEEYTMFLPRVEGWTCYDYSIEFTEQNSEWGLVVMSDNLRFQGLNHVVNFKVNPDKSLTIHDELTQTEYTNLGWQIDPYVYYHFYINGEQPTRNYRHLIPNAEEFYDTL